VRKSNAATVINGKLKNVRRALKRWSKSISQLSLLINNCEIVLKQVDDIEKNKVPRGSREKLQNNCKEAYY
jgi:hypothetical protein